MSRANIFEWVLQYNKRKKKLLHLQSCRHVGVNLNSPVIMCVLGYALRSIHWTIMTLSILFEWQEGSPCGLPWWHSYNNAG